MLASVEHHQEGMLMAKPNSEITVEEQDAKEIPYGTSWVSFENIAFHLIATKPQRKIQKHRVS